MSLSEQEKREESPRTRDIARSEDLELARLLLDEDALTGAAFDRAKHLAAESGERLQTVLTRLGLISERELADILARKLDIPIVGAKDFPDAPVLEAQLGHRFLKESHLIPLKDEDDAVTIAMVRPLDSYALEAVRFATGKRVLRAIAYPSDFEAAYERLYGQGQSDIHRIVDQARDRVNDNFGDDVERLKDIASEAPVIRLVNLLITRAVEAHSSDIHIEPMENDLRVRFRIDGVLQPIESPPRHLGSAIVSRIKIMAKLNIAERRLAQDGRIGMAVRGRDIDFRVATTPTIHGEAVVLRILDRSHLKLDFQALGFEDELAAAFRDILNRPYGIMLVTGPTGSGKTTTLYTALLELNTPDRKILTIEDPVEYQLDGVNQVQVKPQIGLTFPNALRAFLRHDPDVMMIGEIRDLETAQIAVQAALTGHVILSTLHTNDAASAVTRLLDMGVEDYLLTSTINGVAAQRLVRTLCPACRAAYEPLPEFVEKLGLDPSASEASMQLYRAVGCDACNHTGYQGRSAIVEVLPVSDAIREAILRGTDAAQIGRLAERDGMRSMHAHGMKKALAGITSVEEVVRVTRAI